MKTNLTTNRLFFAVLLITGSLFSQCGKGPDRTVTTENLIDEMTDLSRMTNLPEPWYKTVQFSSYDRRSISSSLPGWFSNSDGFGNEPQPGFVEILKEPDAEGQGEYLICDIKGPGAILRFWTAGISGKVRLFIDDPVSPVFEGDASKLFWNPLAALTGQEADSSFQKAYRQFDACYLPVPFSGSCRMEWIGNLKKTHFYHVGVRLYAPGTDVKSWRDADPEIIRMKLEQVREHFNNPDGMLSNPSYRVLTTENTITPGSKKILFSPVGGQAIYRFALKMKCTTPEQTLRKLVLRVWFDDSKEPQVCAPAGDFFGAAPGINPYVSLPFTVAEDSSLICRFVMPFRDKAKFELENLSDEDVTVNGKINLQSYTWKEGKSMYFMARWKIDHNITAQSTDDPESVIPDIPYLDASGKGRLAGIAAFIYNPSNVPTSWGNWWGEGDEKIFVDTDTFPSFFGTGSEDYFNYSWSSDRIFSFPYCGQPRNDGPGNRGYASNFRWHVLDDITFNSKLNFAMELGHHGQVPGFSYGRIAYFYALPGVLCDDPKITSGDLADITYKEWMPVASKGSAGFSFIQAEDLMTENPHARFTSDNIAAGKGLVMWLPEENGETLKLILKSPNAAMDKRIGFTLLNCPAGGEISLRVNGNPVMIDGHETISLSEPIQRKLNTHFSGPFSLLPGRNEVVLTAVNPEHGKANGIDFLWIRK